NDTAHPSRACDIPFQKACHVPGPSAFVYSIVPSHLDAIFARKGLPNGRLPAQHRCIRETSDSRKDESHRVVSRRCCEVWHPLSAEARSRLAGASLPPAFGPRCRCCCQTTSRRGLQCRTVERHV